jgi:hypothetical protein
MAETTEAALAIRLALFVATNQDPTFPASAGWFPAPAP